MKPGRFYLGRKVLVWYIDPNGIINIFVSNAHTQMVSKKAIPLQHWLESSSSYFLLSFFFLTFFCIVLVCLLVCFFVCFWCWYEFQTLSLTKIITWLTCLYSTKIIMLRTLHCSTFPIWCNVEKWKIVNDHYW